MTISDGMKKGAKAAAYIAGGLVALLLIVVLVLLIPSVRGMILSKAVSAANERLPGTLTVRTSKMGLPATLDATGILWVSGADTLIAADRFSISLKILPLIRRDIEVSEMTVQGLSADIPAISAQLAPAEQDDARAAEQAAQRKTAGRSFPRDGSIPGIPSVGVERFHVTAGPLVFSEGLALRSLEASGGVDLLHAGPPEISLERLAASTQGDSQNVALADLEVDLERGLIRAHASGRLSADLPFVLAVSPKDADSFSLVLTTHDQGIPPDCPGVSLEGKLERSGYVLSSVSWDAVIRTPGTSEISHIPELASYVEGLAEVEGVTATTRGALKLKPSLAVDLTLDIQPNSWIEGGGARFAYDGEELRLDGFALRLPDMTLEGRARMSAGEMEAEAGVEAKGTRWLRPMALEMTLPDSLDLTLRATAKGPVKAPEIEAALELAGRMGGFTLDGLSIRASRSSGEAAPVSVGLNAKAKDMVLTTTAEVELARDPTGATAVRLSPLILRGVASQRAAYFEGGEKTGALNYQPREKVLAFRDVRVLGDLGDITLAGKISTGRQGAFELSWAWPEPPPILALALGLSPSQVDSLRPAWEGGRPFALDVAGALSAPGEATEVQAAGSFRLPGPSELAALLPEGAEVGDLGPIGGTFEVKAQSYQSGFGYELSLDLRPTEWIDHATVSAAGSKGVHRLDSLRIALEGLKIDAHGVVDDGQWDAHARLEVEQGGLLSRFIPDTGDSLGISLLATVDFRGSPDAPDLDASLAGTLMSPQYAIPVVRGRAAWTQAGLVASLGAPEGLRINGVRLDSVSASYQADFKDRGMLPASVGFEASGPNLGLYHKGVLDKADGWHLRTDSLRLMVMSRHLGATRPFDFRLHPDKRLVMIRNLDLQGELGVIRVDGYTCPDSCRMSAKADIAFSETPPLESIPIDLWPERLSLTLASTGTEDMTLDGEISGVAFAGKRDVAAAFEITGDAEGVEAELSVASGAENILRVDASLPATVTLYPPAGSLSEGPVSLDAEFYSFPVPLNGGAVGAEVNPAHVGSLDGDLRVRGTPREPLSYSTGRLSFPGAPELSKYWIEFAAMVSPGQGVSPEMLPSPDDEPSHLISDLALPQGGGLGSVFVLKGPEATMLEGSLSYPIVLSFTPLAAKTLTPGEVELRVDSRDLALSVFDDLLPRGYALGGKCRVRLDATGPVDEPSIDGRLEAERVTISLEGGTRVSCTGDLKMEGTGKRPSVKGKIAIESGVIMVPERRRDLHPVEGKSVLWETIASSQAPEGSIRREEATGRAPAAALRGGVSGGEDASRPGNIDLDVDVVIPSGLWIRGNNLAVELTGELSLVQKEALPTISGSLQTLQGRFVLLDRAFTLDRGTVTFYGGDEIDPSLDLMMTTNVDGNSVYLSITGTALDPELKLSSDPEMTDSDIMALLLFGRTGDELDSGQTDLLGKRVASIAASMGGAKLEAKLAQELGVDMIGIRRSTGDEGGSSLVIAKYLSPRVMLKYEQALEESGRFLVNLEYLLAKSFKLETLIGHQDQSAVGLGWSKDY